jgi:protein-L-isoaspartate(D-aspartate) O-methyltransferase
MFERERNDMVEEQIRARGVSHKAILEAMKVVPRHLFVPEESCSESYEDHPVQIGFGQTISQPYIVGLMLELVKPEPSKKLLEIGSGSGYLLALASHLFKTVVGIERIEGLCLQSQQSLEAARIEGVHVLCKDGYEGEKLFAPYDAIIVSCGCPIVPKPLLQQLAVGGILVAPVGESLFQELLIMTKKKDGSLVTISYCGVRFVPLISKHLLEPSEGLQDL